MAKARALEQLLLDVHESRLIALPADIQKLARRLQELAQAFKTYRTYHMEEVVHGLEPWEAARAKHYQDQVAKSTDPREWEDFAVPAPDVQGSKVKLDALTVAEKRARTDLEDSLDYDKLYTMARAAWERVVWFEKVDGFDPSKITLDEYSKQLQRANEAKQTLRELHLAIARFHDKGGIRKMLNDLDDVMKAGEFPQMDEIFASYTGKGGTDADDE